jgi:hypothetical protein
MWSASLWVVFGGIVGCSSQSSREGEEIIAEACNEPDGACLLTESAPEIAGGSTQPTSGDPGTGDPGAGVPGTGDSGGATTGTNDGFRFTNIRVPPVFKFD